MSKLFKSRCHELPIVYETDFTTSMKKSGSDFSCPESIYVFLLCPYVSIVVTIHSLLPRRLLFTQAITQTIRRNDEEYFPIGLTVPLCTKIGDLLFQTICF